MTGLIIEYEGVRIEMYMEYLSFIKQRLENAGCTDTDSLPELRVLLLDTATFLTCQYRACLATKGDRTKSQKLLHAFQNIKEYYHILTNARANDVSLLKQVRSLFINDLDDLQNHAKSNVYIMQQPASLSIARWS